METVADNFEEFGAAVPRSAGKAVPAATSPQREPLLEQFDYVSTSIDHIVKRAGLTATTVSSMLIRLELQGLVQCGAGGYLLYARTAPAKTSRAHGGVITVYHAQYTERPLLQRVGATHETPPHH